MKCLFENDAFSFEALCTASAAYGGTDLGEVLVTAHAIAEGDGAAWHKQWKALAERLRGVGLAALEAARKASARGALLPASGYFRTADFYLRESPVHDAAVAFLSRQVRETFAAAVALLDHPAEPVSIPFEGTRLTGYLFGSDDCGEPRPTLICRGGYDSALEEGYFTAAAAAVRRGYNCLAFDGPGPGSLLRDQGLTFRSEWETVVSAVVDFAVKRPEVDSERLVLMGTSFDGVLAARRSLRTPVGCRRPARHHLRCARVGVARPAGLRGRRSPARRGRHRGPGARPSHGGGHRDALVRVQRDMGIRCRHPQRTATQDPRLHPARRRAADQLPRPGVRGADDATFRGEAHRLTEALTCPYRHILLTDAEGAGGHCHEDAMLAFHQHAFDWIDTALTRCAGGRN